MIAAEFSFEDPRTDALKAIAAALQAQTLAWERFALAAESAAAAQSALVAALDRAEQRALAGGPAAELAAGEE